MHSIQWKQTAWHSVKGQRDKKPWVWEGVRKDNRTFKITFIPHIGYIANSFNGQRIGKGNTLSEAQLLCEKVPGPQVVRVAK